MGGLGGAPGGPRKIKNENSTKKFYCPCGKEY